MPVPGRSTFDASPVAVRAASAGGALTSGGAGICGVASVWLDAGWPPRPHALDAAIAQLRRAIVHVRVSM